MARVERGGGRLAERSGERAEVLGYDDGRACVDRGPSHARGNHVGKGPRGFRRSDQRILLSLSEMLEDHPEIDAAGMTVSCQSGEVTLCGTVSSAAMRERAETCARAVPGVLGVINQVRLAPPAASADADAELDRVDEASLESMIASDPPAAGVARMGSPRRTHGNA